MTIRPSGVRFKLALIAALCALLAGACGSGQENSRPSNNVQGTNAPSNTSGNSANPGGGSVAKAKLNLNTASGAEFLANIPGLGNKMVHEFEEYRPYRSIQQFRREIGKYVKPDQVAEYEKYVFVPIAINESDAATLQQIPGLDAAEAQALIAGRPYASNDAFLSKLSGSVSEAELAVAKTYLTTQ